MKIIQTLKIFQTLKFFPNSEGQTLIKLTDKEVEALKIRPKILRRSSTMVLKMSAGQWMPLSSDKKDNLYDHYLQHIYIYICNVYEATFMFFRKERLIPHQGKDSNSFFHRTLTKSSNKSMMIEQASQTTLWCTDTFSTSLFYLYIMEWRLED